MKACTTKPSCDVFRESTANEVLQTLVATSNNQRLSFIEVHQKHWLNKQNSQSNSLPLRSQPFHLPMLIKPVWLQRDHFKMFDWPCFTFWMRTLDAQTTFLLVNRRPLDIILLDTQSRFGLRTASAMNHLDRILFKENQISKPCW